MHNLSVIFALILCWWCPILARSPEDTIVLATKTDLHSLSRTTINVPKDKERSTPIGALGRRNTPESNNKTMLVDVIVIGVQKGGSTSLAKTLEQHPLIAMAPRELHFFDIDTDICLQS